MKTPIRIITCKHMPRLHEWRKQYTLVPCIGVSAWISKYWKNFDVYLKSQARAIQQSNRIVRLSNQDIVLNIFICIDLFYILNYGYPITCIHVYYDTPNGAHVILDMIFILFDEYELWSAHTKYSVRPTVEFPIFIVIVICRFHHVTGKTTYEHMSDEQINIYSNIVLNNLLE